MAVGDVLEVRLVCNAGDQAAFNIRDYRVSVEVAPVPTRDQIAADLDGFFRPVYTPLLSSQASFNGVGVRKVLPIPPSVESFSTGGVTFGTGGANLLPRQVSGIITLRTALAGRRFRGRVYIPYPSEEDNVATAAPNAAYVGLLASAGAFFALTRTVTVGLGSITLVPVIRSKRFSLLTDVASITARAKWATQRRRGSFGRPNVPPA